MRKKTGITISTNVAYSVVKQGEGEEIDERDKNAEYEVVCSPHPHLPSHPLPQPAQTGNFEVPCPPEHHHNVLAIMIVPPVPQDGGTKGPAEAVYEPIPGDQ